MKPRYFSEAKIKLTNHSRVAFHRAVQVGLQDIPASCGPPYHNRNILLDFDQSRSHHLKKTSYRKPTASNFDALLFDMFC